MKMIKHKLCGISSLHKMLSFTEKYQDKTVKLSYLYAYLQVVYSAIKSLRVCIAFFLHTQSFFLENF